MKKGIHPNWHENARVLVNGKEVMTLGSTLEEINVEIWSGNHPFYTGQETLVDTDNLVEKFNKRTSQANTARVSKTIKKAKRRAQKSSVFAQKSLTLKDMLQNL